MYSRGRKVRIYVRNKNRYNPETKERDFLYVDIVNFATTTIGQIKEDVRRQCGNHVKIDELFLNNQPLADDRSVAHYNLEDGNILETTSNPFWVACMYIKAAEVRQTQEANPTDAGIQSWTARSLPKKYTIIQVLLNSKNENVKQPPHFPTLDALVRYLERLGKKGANMHPNYTQRDLGDLENQYHNDFVGRYDDPIAAFVDHHAVKLGYIRADAIENRQQPRAVVPRRIPNNHLHDDDDVDGNPQRPAPNQDRRNQGGRGRGGAGRGGGGQQGHGGGGGGTDQAGGTGGGRGRGRKKQVPFCEDCEVREAEVYCPDCPGARDGYGLSLCRYCSGDLHIGATRRRHNILDIGNAPKVTRPYCPKAFMAPFAIMVAMYSGLNEVPPKLSMTEDEIKERAQPLTDTDLIDKQNGKYMGGFDCLENSLINKGLVKKEASGHPTYALAETGVQCGERLYIFQQALFRFLGSCGLPRKPENFSTTWGRRKVVLIVDDNERDKDRLLMYAAQKGIDAQVRLLPAGDYIWILTPPLADPQQRYTSTDSSVELVLPFVVERKSWEDLEHSVTSSRFKKQINNMMGSGIKNLFYLMEGSVSGMRYRPTQQQQQFLKNEVEKLLLHYGFYINYTASWMKSAQWLLWLTRMIVEGLQMGVFQDECIPYPEYRSKVAKQAGLPVDDVPFARTQRAIYNWEALHFINIIFRDTLKEQKMVESTIDELGTTPGGDQARKVLLIITGLEDYNKKRQSMFNKCNDAVFDNPRQAKSIVDNHVSASVHRLVHYDIASYWQLYIQVICGVYVVRTENGTDTQRLQDEFMRPPPYNPADLQTEEQDDHGVTVYPVNSIMQTFNNKIEIAGSLMITTTDLYYGRRKTTSPRNSRTSGNGVNKSPRRNMTPGGSTGKRGKTRNIPATISRLADIEPDQPAYQGDHSGTWRLPGGATDYDTEKNTTGTHSGSSKRTRVFTGAGHRLGGDDDSGYEHGEDMFCGRETGAGVDRDNGPRRGLILGGGSGVSVPASTRFGTSPGRGADRTVGDLSIGRNILDRGILGRGRPAATATVTTADLEGGDSDVDAGDDDKRQGRDQSSLSAADCATDSQTEEYMMQQALAESLVEAEPDPSDSTNMTPAGNEGDSQEEIARAIQLSLQEKEKSVMSPVSVLQRRQFSPDRTDRKASSPKDNAKMSSAKGNKSPLKRKGKNEGSTEDDLTKAIQLSLAEANGAVCGVQTTSPIKHPSSCAATVSKDVPNSVEEEERLFQLAIEESKKLHSPEKLNRSSTNVDNLVNNSTSAKGTCSLEDEDRLLQLATDKSKQLISGRDGSASNTVHRVSSNLKRKSTDVIVLEESQEVDKEEGFVDEEMAEEEVIEVDSQSQEIDEPAVGGANNVEMGDEPDDGDDNDDMGVDSDEDIIPPSPDKNSSFKGGGSSSFTIRLSQSKPHSQVSNRSGNVNTNESPRSSQKRMVKENEHGQSPSQDLFGGSQNLNEEDDNYYIGNCEADLDTEGGETGDMDEDLEKDKRAEKDSGFVAGFCTYTSPTDFDRHHTNKAKCKSPSSSLSDNKIDDLHDYDSKIYSLPNGMGACNDYKRLTVKQEVVDHGKEIQDKEEAIYSRTESVFEYDTSTYGDCCPKINSGLSVTGIKPEPGDGSRQASSTKDETVNDELMAKLLQEELDREAKEEKSRSVQDEKDMENTKNMYTVPQNSGYDSELVSTKDETLNDELMAKLLQEQLDREAKEKESNSEGSVKSDRNSSISPKKQGSEGQGDIIPYSHDDHFSAGVGSDGAGEGDSVVDDAELAKILQEMDEKEEEEDFPAFTIEDEGLDERERRLKEDEEMAKRMQEELNGGKDAVTPVFRHHLDDVSSPSSQVPQGRYRKFFLADRQLKEKAAIQLEEYRRAHANRYQSTGRPGIKYTDDPVQSTQTGHIRGRPTDVTSAGGVRSAVRPGNGAGRRPASTITNESATGSKPLKNNSFEVIDLTPPHFTSELSQSQSSYQHQGEKGFPLTQPGSASQSQSKPSSSQLVPVESSSELLAMSNVKCGSCGNKGHSRTAKTCPNYYSEQETNRRDTMRAESQAKQKKRAEEKAKQEVESITLLNQQKEVLEEMTEQIQNQMGVLQRGLRRRAGQLEDEVLERVRQMEGAKKRKKKK